MATGTVILLTGRGVILGSSHRPMFWITEAEERSSLKRFTIVTLSLTILATACGRNGEPKACKVLPPSMADLLAKSWNRHLIPDYDPEYYREGTLRFALPAVEEAPEAIRSAVSTLRRAFEQWRPGEDLSVNPEAQQAAEEIDRWADANCKPRDPAPTTTFVLTTAATR